MNIKRSPIYFSIRPRFAEKVFTGCLLTIVVITGALAQSDAPRITAETVLRYLQKDLYISPGVGFQKVQIGNSFNQVEQAWGRPNRKLESSETGNSTIWVYLVDRHSEIAVGGSSTVSTIRVLGSLNSPYSSVEGAHFGMTPHQIISIYGTPADKNNLTRLRYPKKGIAFAFELGALKAIQVQPPSTPAMVN